MTPKQKDLLDRLKEGSIAWYYTKPHESRTLNELVRQGFAEWYNVRKIWMINTVEE